MSDESLKETEEKEIVYLDPMEIEVDEYNVRHDSPIDRDTIERIKEDLRNGGKIEYHITVRIKDRKYYCYIGRNRLIAVKEYVEETNRKMMIPAKIKNVSNRMALKLSLDENIKRKELLPSEISGALKRLYEEWKEEKKYIKYINQGFMSSRRTKIVNIQETDKKYIQNTEGSRGRPEDPFSIRTFVKENNVPLKKSRVARLIAIDDLPLEIKRGLDEGYIDDHTAYELTKFSRGEQLNLYNYFRSFRMIPRDVRVDALKKYMDNRDQPFNVLLINEYRKYISSSYPIFSRLSDTQIADIAQNIESGKLGKLTENLEYMIEEGLRLEEIRLTHIKKLESLSKEELKRYSEYKRMLKIKAEQLGMKFRDEDLALAYLRDGEIVFRREEAELNVWMHRLNISKPEDFRKKLRGRGAEARDEVKRVMRFLTAHPSKYAVELRRILEKGDWIVLRKTMDNIYDYLLKSPGYIEKERRKRRRTRKGILYRLYGREYSVGETLIREWFNRNKDSVKKGVEIIIDILDRIENILDYESFQTRLLERLEKLPIDTEIHDMNPDEYKRFSKYISLMQRIDSFLELYVYIREYIGSMDEYMRNVRAEEVRKLTGAYRGFMRTVKAVNGEIQYSEMEKYISQVKNRDICNNVVTYINLRNEIEDSLVEIEDDINSIEKLTGNEMIVDQLRRKYAEHKSDFEEYTRQCYMRGLELLKDRVDRFIEEYSRELSRMLNKTVAVRVKKCCEYEPVLLIRTVNDELRCSVLSNADYSDDVEEDVEYMGEEYEVVLEKETHFRVKSIRKKTRKKVSQIDT